MNCDAADRRRHVKRSSASRHGQVSIQLFSGPAILLLLQVESNQRHVVRRYAEWPDDALLIVALLHQRSHDTPNANTIRAHENSMRYPLGIQVGCTEQLPILCAWFEDVAHLAATNSVQRSTAVHAGSSIVSRGDIFPFICAKIPRIVHVLHVIIHSVGTGNEVIAKLQRYISYDIHPLILI